MERIKMREKLQEKLPAKRYEHSLGVEYTAGTMAFIYGVDLEKSLIAGLLHDCAKYVPNDKKIAKCKKRGIPITDYELKNPELLHAKLSAVYAKEKYGVEDEEILSAIRSHTTGKPAMSTLDKIIYIADYIEPNRNILPDMEQIRKEAYKDLDVCLIHILRNCVNYLQKKGSTMDPVTMETYNYYKNHICLEEKNI